MDFDTQICDADDRAAVHEDALSNLKVERSTACANCKDFDRRIAIVQTQLNGIKRHRGTCAPLVGSSSSVVGRPGSIDRLWRGKGRDYRGKWIPNTPHTMREKMIPYSASGKDWDTNQQELMGEGGELEKDTDPQIARAGGRRRNTKKRRRRNTKKRRRRNTKKRRRTHPSTTH